MVHLRLSHLTAIAHRHGFQSPDALPTPWVGATSRVYPCGDVVVKVACDAADAMNAVTIDAAMNPIIRKLGVQTPDLIAFDDSRDLQPVPFSVYRRVPHSAPISQFSKSPGLVASAWEAVGRELALVHQVPYRAEMPIALREFRQSPHVDPRPWAEDLHARGVLDSTDMSWLQRLLDYLARFALGEVPLTLCHGDVNAANVLVDSTNGQYLALIDWAGVGWLDPVWDFAGVPFSVVPFLLAGHRSVAPLPSDETAEARVCWCQMQTRLHAANAHLDESSAARLRRDLEAVRAFVARQDWSIPVVG